MSHIFHRKSEPGPVKIRIRGEAPVRRGNAGRWIEPTHSSRTRRPTLSGIPCNDIVPSPGVVLGLRTGHLRRGSFPRESRAPSIHFCSGWLECQLPGRTRSVCWTDRDAMRRAVRLTERDGPVRGAEFDWNPTRAEAPANTAVQVARLVFQLQIVSDMTILDANVHIRVWLLG